MMHGICLFIEPLSEDQRRKLSEIPWVTHLAVGLIESRHYDFHLSERKNEAEVRSAFEKATGLSVLVSLAG